jgi:hypothetical protein
MPHKGPRLDARLGHQVVTTPGPHLPFYVILAPGDSLSPAVGVPSLSNQSTIPTFSTPFRLFDGATVTTGPDTLGETVIYLGDGHTVAVLPNSVVAVKLWRDDYLAVPAFPPSYFSNVSYLKLKQGGILVSSGLNNAGLYTASLSSQGSTWTDRSEGASGMALPIAGYGGFQTASLPSRLFFGNDSARFARNAGFQGGFSLQSPLMSVPMVVVKTTGGNAGVMGSSFLVTLSPSGTTSIFLYDCISATVGSINGSVQSFQSGFQVTVAPLGAISSTLIPKTILK